MSQINPSTINQYIRDNIDDDIVIEDILHLTELNTEYVLDEDVKQIFTLPIFMTDRSHKDVLKELCNSFSDRWIQYYRQYKHTLLKDCDNKQLYMNEIIFNLSLGENDDFYDDKFEAINDIVEFLFDIGLELSSIAICELYRKHGDDIFMKMYLSFYRYINLHALKYHLIPLIHKNSNGKYIFDTLIKNGIIPDKKMMMQAIKCGSHDLVQVLLDNDCPRFYKYDEEYNINEHFTFRIAHRIIKNGGPLPTNICENARKWSDSKCLELALKHGYS
jgi:hypothetical protein